MRRFKARHYERFADECMARRKRLLASLARQAASDEHLKEEFDATAWELRRMNTEAALLGLNDIAAAALLLAEKYKRLQTGIGDQSIGLFASWCDRLTRVSCEIARETEPLDQWAARLRALCDDALTTELQSRTSSTAPLEHEGDAPNHAKARVIVLDDSEIDREMLTAELREHGYDVTAAKDLNELARYVAKFQPDAIVTDVVMPDTEGDEICRVLKKDLDLPTTPMLLVSALPPDVLQDRAKQAGADGYVAKEYGMDAVARALDELLSDDA